MRTRLDRVVPAARLATLVIAALALAACGFQPRGQAIAVGSIPPPLAITGLPSFAPLHRELRAQADAAGVAVTADTAAAGTVLRILDRRTGSRVLSVDSANKAVEFELELAVRFAVTDAGGGERAAAQTVRALRILYRPREDVLAGDREAAVLRAEMRREIAGRVLARVAAGPR